MKRRRRWLTLGVALLAGILGSAAPAQADIYLSKPIISVALGPAMPPEPFANRTTADSLASIIDALTATSSELHLQTTHVWVSGSTLEIDFDLGPEYNLSTFHFWNYHTESFDVDDVDLRFFDSSGTFLGTIENLSSTLGNDTGMDSTPIFAQNFDLEFPSNIRYINAVLASTNNEVDFNNIGFSGDVSIIPGDVNGDGSVNLLDVTLFVKLLTC